MNANASGSSDAATAQGASAASPAAEDAEAAGVAAVTLTPEQMNERLAEEVAQITGLLSDSQTSLHNMLQVSTSVSNTLRITLVAV